MAPKTERNPDWFDIEGTFAQVDSSPGGAEYEARELAAQEEMAMAKPEVETAKKADRPPEATHKVGKNQPVKVEGSYRMFTDEPVYLTRIGGGKRRGPAVYRACTSFGAHMDGRHTKYEEGCRLQAPKVYVLKRLAKP